jgi:hypothetical protein
VTIRHGSVLTRNFAKEVSLTSAETRGGHRVKKGLFQGDTYERIYRTRGKVQ